LKLACGQSLPESYDVMVSYRDFRPAERVLVVYFTYVAIASSFFPLNHSTPYLVALTIAGIFAALGYLEKTTTRPIIFRTLRDWTALAATLVAYREMDLFTPAHHDHHLEAIWIVWDRYLIHELGFQRVIESTGLLIPWILEFCYLVVYAVGPFSMAILYGLGKGERAQRFLVVYLLGTLLAYACFPYFPSEPPRTVYPGTDMPNIVTWFRRSNLLVVGNYGIHSSVFPSAHVSSAFAAGFGMLQALPERKSIGYGLVVYAALVAIATIYGRYHYAVDAVAGAGIAVAVMMLTRSAIMPFRPATETKTTSLKYGE
jgi:membrane-associated phospholipid phosphatase